MPTLQELESALRNADAAGDVPAAQALAAEYQRLKSAGAETPTQLGAGGGAPPMETPPAPMTPTQLPEVDPMIRAIVGLATRPEQKVATLHQLFPQASVTPAGDNYIIDDPQKGKLQYNAPGLSMGDIASIGPEVAELGGGTLGALAGSASGGPLGAAAGGGLGAAAGRELYTQTAAPILEQATGVQLPARTGGQIAQDVGTTALLNAGGQLGGELVGAGLKWAGKYLFRGGAEGGRQFAQAVTDANRWGVPISVGQAADNGWTVFDTMAGPQAKVFKQRVEEATGKAVNDLAQSIGRGRALTYEGVGRRIQQGVEAYGKTFRAKGQALDQAFFDLVPKDTSVPVTNTLAAIQRVLPDLPSMPATAGAELKSSLGQRMTRLLQDIQDGGGALQLNDIRTFRRQIGEMIETGGLVEDIPVLKLRDLHAALTADMQGAAQEAGPAAQMAFQRSQTYWANELRTMDDVVRPLISKNVPSEIARALEGKMKNAPEYTRELLRTLSPDARDVIRAATIRKLGIVTKSGQGAAGDTWSFDKFLADWNGLDRTTRNILFKDQSYTSDLDALARTAERISKSNIGQQQGPIPKYMVAGAVGSAALTALGAAGGVGAWSMLPIGFALTSMGAAGGQKLMRSRVFVNWLAKAVTTSPASIGAHIGRLSAIAENADPQTREDIHDFLDSLSQTGQ
jgi:hypothetical protein